MLSIRTGKGGTVATEVTKFEEATAAGPDLVAEEELVLETGGKYIFNAFK